MKYDSGFRMVIIITEATEPELVSYKVQGFENKTNASIFEAFVYLLLSLAGSTGSVGNPLLQNFILVGRKLETLGFMYCAGKVMVVNPRVAAHRPMLTWLVGLRSEAIRGRGLINRRVTG